MAAPLQPFESSWQKDIERKQLKEQRERYLEKAKSEYDRREKKKEDARQRGEGTWMLPCVADRVDKDEQVVKKRKLKKQKSEKKKKKEKKEKSKSKKAKKKKKKKGKDSSDSSSDSSDSDSEMEWKEKSDSPAPTPAPAALGPKLGRQDWMVDPLADIFGGVTREQIREQKKKDAGIVEEEKTSVIDQLGQHDKELNPYWKSGGSGLPEEDPNKKKSKKTGSVAGDGGLSWWRKSYQRCVEAAEEEGRTLEEVAADRYGSLKKLEKMIAEAEKRSSKVDDNRSSKNWGRGREPDRERDRYSERRPGGGMGGRFMKPGESGSSNTDRRKMFMKPGEDKKKFSFMKPGEESESRTSASSSSSSSAGWRKGGRQDSDSVPSWKKVQSTQSRDRDRDRGRDSGRDRSKERSRDRSRERKRSRDRSGSRGRDRSGSRDRRDRSRSRDRQRDRSKDRTDDRRRERSRSKDRSSQRRSAERSGSKDRQRRRSPSSSSDSSSDSESEAESSAPPSASESEPEPEPVRVLTEDEMNKLGAKILRAEMMGNEEMVTKLKAELEEARTVKASAGAAAAARPPRPAAGGKDEDNVVVLTRTDRSGNVRPLPAGKHEGGDGGGRRRKKEKVSTHSKGGDRERYFADDDKHNLKELVKQEKMSTAEDANHMFARLAGRSIEKTDDEYQLDDVMVNRANKKMSDAKTEERDRGAAIYEHRKMQSTLDKCKFCFDNIPKHLIIAIGLKVILCLPAHRSMVPGHCLIIPMQHTVSGTAVDDDVWTEIQVFRKGLTAMFKEQEEDVVFMETSMHLKHYPHMVVEVIPMPSETGEMAPIYFKKAIQESDTEWAQNKKLIDLSQKNVRHSVPKGFPYFSVDFGLQGGFAHVIEDEQIFPSYFGREICGGMMDVEPNLWRKPHKEDFERQRQKVLKFADWWKPYDWTQKLKADNDSDSN